MPLVQRCFDCGSLENLKEIKRLLREADERGGGVTQTTILCVKCRDDTRVSGMYMEVFDEEKV